MRRLWIAVLAALVAPVSADIVGRGWREYRGGRWPHSNQGLQDRDAIRWLLARRQPGDVIITTRLGAPALWWYGEVPVHGPSAGGAMPDGTPILEAAREPGHACDSGSVTELMCGYRRALVYSGFPDQPAGFVDLLLDTLAPAGAVAEERHFDLLGHAAVVELGSAAAGRARRARVVEGVTLDGCVSLAPARRW